MSKSSFINFKAVKEAITMEQVLEHYQMLNTFKRSGQSLSGPCPIHKGDNPTQFRINLTKNIWNCFSKCKHGGNVLDFIAEMDGVSIHKAALNAIEWFGLDRESMSKDAEEERTNEVPKVSGAPKPDPARPETPKPEMSKPSPAAVAENGESNKPLKFRLDKLERNHPYLAERGLTPETIIDFGLGYCTKGVMAGRIAIPIHNVKGEVMAYVGRWPGEPPDQNTPKYKLPPNFKKSLELFNIDRAVKEPADKPLVIVEGFFDVIKIHQNGWRKVIALMGSTMSAVQEELIRRHTEANSLVVLMLDEDEAGQTGREAIAIRLSRFCFVKTHVFDQPNTQPEQLSAEELQDILEVTP